VNFGVITVTVSLLKIASASGNSEGHATGEFAERDEIWEAVVRDGWSEAVGVFTQYVGSTALDASNLMMASDFCPPPIRGRSPPSMRSRSGSLTTPAGLPVPHRRRSRGHRRRRGHHLALCVLAGTRFALADQVDRARAVFERAAAFANDLGLLAEEVDAQTGELLGNFPHAFSHIAFANAAWAISEAERRARSLITWCLPGRHGEIIWADAFAAWLGGSARDRGVGYRSQTAMSSIPAEVKLGKRHCAGSPCTQAQRP
jgi:Glycosyl hydrolases family 15